MEVPLAEVDSTPGRRWNSWKNAPIHGVDTARIGLLRVRVWRFRRTRIPGAGGCLTPLRCVSQAYAVLNTAAWQGGGSAPLRPPGSSRRSPSSGRAREAAPRTPLAVRPCLSAAPPAPPPAYRRGLPLRRDLHGNSRGPSQRNHTQRPRTMPPATGTTTWTLRPQGMAVTRNQGARRRHAAPGRTARDDGIPAINATHTSSWFPMNPPPNRLITRTRKAPSPCPGADNPSPRTKDRGPGPHRRTDQHGYVTTWSLGGSGLHGGVVDGVLRDTDDLVGVFIDEYLRVNAQAFNS